MKAAAANAIRKIFTQFLVLTSPKNLLIRNPRLNVANFVCESWWHLLSFGAEFDVQFLFHTHEKILAKEVLFVYDFVYYLCPSEHFADCCKMHVRRTAVFPPHCNSFVFSLECKCGQPTAWAAVTKCFCDVTCPSPPLPGFFQFRLIEDWLRPI